MNDLKSMRTFVEVAKLGSFAAAAKSLGLSTSSVSRLVMELENWLGTPVLRRTPRNVALTNAGEQFLERCIGIIADTDNLQKDAQALTDQPKGNLTIAAAAHPARKLVAPLLPKFISLYPEIKLDLRLHNRAIDLVGEGIDVAIRIGHLPDSSMIAKKCGEVRLLYSASPEFFAKHGHPKSLDALPAYPCIIGVTPTYGRQMPPNPGSKINGPIMANDGEFIRQMTLAGIGISQLPNFFIDEDLEAGDLVSLFEGQFEERMGIYLLYRSSGKITAASRAFIDFIAENLDAN
jgi:DNA-binding transcriptional LysR family regulator